MPTSMGGCASTIGNASHIASVKLCADETMQGHQQQCLP